MTCDKFQKLGIVVPNAKGSWTNTCFFNSGSNFCGFMPHDYISFNGGEACALSFQAFGAIASIEAAYYRQTGQQKLFSEQLLMDCSWDDQDQNKGCMGGFQNLAYQWLLPKGFVTTEDSYPYEGTTDFCRKDPPKDVTYTKVHTNTLTSFVFCPFQRARDCSSPLRSSIAQHSSRCTMTSSW